MTRRERILNNLCCAGMHLAHAAQQVWWAMLTAIHLREFSHDKHTRNHRP